MRGLFLPPSPWRSRSTIVRGVAIHTDTLQKNARWFVGWVLGDEVALESTFENRLAQALRAQKSSFQLRLKFVNYRETAIRFISDSDLLPEGRNWNWSWPNIVQVEVRSCHVSFCLLDV